MKENKKVVSFRIIPETWNKFTSKYPETSKRIRELIKKDIGNLEKKRTPQDELAVTSLLPKEKEKRTHILFQIGKEMKGKFEEYCKRHNQHCSGVLRQQIREILEEE